VTLKESYAAAVDELGETVNRGANEVLLLHGTRPEVGYYIYI
jgi:2-iminoacetate synthase ThiH